MADPILTVQDIIDNMNDLVANYTTGNVDLGNRMRAINRAIEYLKRYMTFPSDETMQQISFTQDNMFYDLDEDFNEGLVAYYSDLNQNTPGREWTYKPYPDLLRITGQRFRSRNYFSWTPINGKMQLMLLGRNLHQGTTLCTFDSLVSPTISGSNDAENLRSDVNIKKEGAASLAFDINPALTGSGKASITILGNWDFTTLLNNGGLFKLWVWLASTNIAGLTMTLFSDASDFYTLAQATEFDDGTAFTTGLDTFKKVEFNFTNAVVSGSPVINSITSIQIDIDLGPGFVLTESFRIDDLFTIVPDNIDFVYLTSYKGTDSTGQTPKIFLTDPSDIPAFANYIPDMLDVVAYRAAMVLVPQIMSNAQFREMYKEELKEIISIVGKSWPRKRVLNLGSLYLRR